MADENAVIGGGDYLTDVPYARTFIHLLSPSVLRLVAALNGVPAPPGDDFDYCELGSGSGDTTTTFAAAYPRARFVGVDFNAEHVAFARGLARRGGVENVRFVERDFEDLGREELPDFDFIGAHGVLSWISAEKRAALVAFARAKLKPGGLLYVSYNALPGWAAIEPLRRFLMEQTGGTPGTTLDRARRGLELARRLSDAGAVFFKNHPTAKSMLDVMQKAGLPYVAHEYFQKSWGPMYFTDVARMMADSDLHYVGQIPLHLNFRELTMAPGLAELGASITDRIAFESSKDFASNEFFRSDVYIKGKAAPSEATTRDFFERTPFGTLAPREQIQRELRLPYAALKFEGPLYDALIPEIAGGAASSADLASRPSLAAFGARRIGDALKTLTLAGQVVPMTPASRPQEVEGARRIPLAFNRLVIEQSLSRENPLVLASPVSGTGILLSILDVVCLRLWTEVPDAGRRDAWIRALVAESPLRLVVRDRRIDDAEQLVRAVSEEFERFRVHWPRKLEELGILG